MWRSAFLIECQATVAYAQEDVCAANLGGNSYRTQGDRSLLSYRSNNALGPPPGPPPGFNQQMQNQSRNPPRSNQNVQNSGYNQNQNHGFQRNANQGFGNNNYGSSSNENQNVVLEEFMKQTAIQNQRQNIVNKNNEDL